MKKSREPFKTMLENPADDLDSIMRSMPQGENNDCLRLALRHVRSGIDERIEAIDGGQYDAWLGSGNAPGGNNAP